MPFNQHKKWISVEKAERDMEEPTPEWEDFEPDTILASYKSLLRSMDDRHAFDHCVIDFGFKITVTSLASVSAVASYFNRKATR